MDKNLHKKRHYDMMAVQKNNYNHRKMSERIIARPKKAILRNGALFAFLREGGRRIVRSRYDQELERRCAAEADFL